MGTFSCVCMTSVILSPLPSLLPLSLLLPVFPTSPPFLSISLCARDWHGSQKHRLKADSPKHGRWSVVQPLMVSMSPLLTILCVYILKEGMAPHEPFLLAMAGAVQLSRVQSWCI